MSFLPVSHVPFCSATWYPFLIYLEHILPWLYEILICTTDRAHKLKLHGEFQQENAVPFVEGRKTAKN